MEKTITNGLNRAGCLPARIEMQAFCSKCGHKLGIYTPPCYSHRFRCESCGAELEVQATVNESGISTLSCCILATKKKDK